MRSLLNVCISRFADNLLLDIPREMHAPTETENPHSSQDGEASMNTSLGLLSSVLILNRSWKHI